MKRKFLIHSLLGVLVVSNIQARTWTSADGANTFDGDLLEYDVAASTLKVKRSDGQTITFGLDKLSEADRTFVAEWKPPVEEVSVEEALEGQVIGKALNKVTLEKLDGKRYKKTELQTAPKYYLLYFSASW